MDKKFIEWVATLSKIYRQTQIKAAVKVNSELISFYFNLGKEISKSNFKKAYGSQFYKKLSEALRKEIPKGTGFSTQNLRYCESFYKYYKKIFQQPVGKLETELITFEKLTLIPWGHHICIIEKCSNDCNKAIFYINKIINNGWSRSILQFQIANNLYEREGKAITNFSIVYHKDEYYNVQQVTRDPYIFNLLEIDELTNETKIKNSMVSNVKETLLELGKGFAFLEQEYRVSVGNRDFYIDLLFYNIPLHCYVVIEVKTDEFEPEYLGQLSLYVSAIDKKVRGKSDNKTIGLLLCKDKNEEIVQYTVDNFKIPLGISSYEFSKLVKKKNKKEI